MIPTKAMPPAQTTSAGTTMISTLVPGVFNCNFDRDLCGWVQDKTDTFDWTRQRGRTSSSGTGPSSDHTGGG